MSFWSLSWETFKDRRGYLYPEWGQCWTWAWGWQSSRCGLHSSYQLGQQGSSSRWGPGGPAGPTGPTGPGGQGGRGGGAGPPPGPLAPPPGGTGAAISNTQCNNRLNPTLVVDNWSFYYCLCKRPGRLQTIVGLQIASDFGHLCTFIGLRIASDPGHLL